MTSFCRFVLALVLAFALATSTVHIASAQPKAPPLPREPKPVEANSEGAPVSYLVGSDADIANDQRIRQALAKPISLDLKEVKLKDVMAQLADELDVAIVLTKQIEDAGVEADHPITLKVPKVSLRTCLRLILSDLNLTYFISGEVIKITPIGN